MSEPNLDFSFQHLGVTQEDTTREEENCDRETESILWGAYFSEQVDCPSPNLESDEPEDDDVDDDDVD
ncbi:MAG: hypothetical protein KME17_08485 [Cyanosarcina radialis HA8281-LM2]|jgi:hypothetical protein|nr:hypothetical protein [Cyanosarcina radialis HA8281-LM2]